MATKSKKTIAGKARELPDRAKAMYWDILQACTKDKQLMTLAVLAAKDEFKTNPIAFLQDLIELLGKDAKAQSSMNVHVNASTNNVSAGDSFAKSHLAAVKAAQPVLTQPAPLVIEHKPGAALDTRNISVDESKQERNISVDGRR